MFYTCTYYYDNDRVRFSSQYKLFRMIYKQLKSFSIRFEKHPRQQDVTNCGVLALKAVELYLKLKNVKSLHYSSDACLDYRDEFKNIILESG